MKYREQILLYRASPHRLIALWQQASGVILVDQLPLMREESLPHCQASLIVPISSLAKYEESSVGVLLLTHIPISEGPPPTPQHRVSWPTEVFVVLRTRRICSGGLAWACFTKKVLCTPCCRSSNAGQTTATGIFGCSHTYSLPCHGTSRTCIPTNNYYAVSGKYRGTMYVELPEDNPKGD
jgi:hypothetical protein